MDRTETTVIKMLSAIEAPLYDTADIAFCVAAYAHGMDEVRMERALEDNYLSRDPSLSKRASYIRKTMTKARDWIER